MTPTEATAALTYASQLDARVPVNEANADLWASALAGMSVEQVKWIIKDHYTRSTDFRGEVPALTPAVIRRRGRIEAERAAAKRAALEAAPRKKATGGTWRSRNPAEWDRLVQAGAVDWLEQMERRGLLDASQARRLQVFRETGTLPPRGTPTALHPYE